MDAYTSDNIVSFGIIISLLVKLSMDCETACKKKSPGIKCTLTVVALNTYHHT